MIPRILAGAGAVVLALAAANAAATAATATTPTTGIAAAASTTAADIATATAPPRFIYSPYKFLPLNRWKEGIIGVVGTNGKQEPVLAGRHVPLTWAFATGECGEEAWGEQAGAQVAANVRGFADAGVDYVISTGGQGGIFTCATDEGMERFVARYESRHLAGIDFDIEAGQTAAQVDSLLQRAANAQRRRPQLRFSFTVATHAASDGSRRSLNALGESILAAVRASGLRGWTFNLMVMDYGAPEAAVCVVKGAGCDMAASAVQAVRNVHEKYGIPLGQLEVTPMIGVNDTARNEFTTADARALGAAVRSMGLAGLHWWSLDRDRPCAAPVPGASDQCHGLQDGAGAFGQAFEAGLRPVK